jgi:acetamidase/formamidase
MDVVDLRLVLRPDLRLDRPRACSPRGWITFGFDESLDRAIEQALGDMIALVMEMHGVGRKHALALMSAVVDVHFTQLVNGVRGVHAILPDDAIVRVGGRAEPA